MNDAVSAATLSLPFLKVIIIRLVSKLGAMLARSVLVKIVTNEVNFVPSYSKLISVGWCVLFVCYLGLEIMSSQRRGGHSILGHNMGSYESDF